MSVPVLVVITADDCGACIDFKKNIWPGVKKTLEDTKSVEIIHKELPSIGSALPEDLPKDLGRFVPYYPSIILITRNSWNGGKGTNLQAVAFNGVVDAATGKVKRIDQKQLQAFSQIPAWVKQSLLLPEFNRVSAAPATQTAKAVLVHDISDGPVKVLPVCTGKYYAL